MKVRWTHTAIEHLASIYQYLARDAARYAQRMVDRITSRFQQVARFPSSGQMVPEYRDPDIREVLQGQHRVIYEVTASEIRILAVIHGAQLLPLEPPTEPST